MSATATTSVKDAVIDVIRQMPDDATVEDIISALYVRQKIDAGLRDVAEGRVVSHEVAKKRLDGGRHKQEDAR
jgi:predicted transcriptional regulator